MTTCELCRVDPAHSKHHFIPVTLHANKWFKVRFTRQQMSDVIKVCQQRHHMIHELIPSEKELGRNYNTKEKLVAHPAIADYLKWKKS